MKTSPASGLSGIAPDPSINPLVFDFLEWLAISPRPYTEVMDVWRTSCPRLTIWEDAVDLGYVVRRHDERPPAVFLTAFGRQALERRRQRALARA
ncbi:MAG TPA: hypothetical protein VN814_24000 [Caulobacteraceae bacterium]|nr:hypothetical protein [Caulobacteraceae bacterium]